MRRRRSIVPLVALVTLGAGLVGCDYAFGPHLLRVDGPVVLTGQDLGAAALGVAPDRVLAYRWHRESAAWVQIPVQVDERVVIDFGVMPATNAAAGVPGTVYGSGTPSGVAMTQYADPHTWVGADPDPTVDADDEVVFLARDAGYRAPANVAPPPTSASPAFKEIEIADPDGGAAGYVYLFLGRRGTDPSAGVDHVAYTFALESGDYRSTYRRRDGPNPEQSRVVTDNYTVGFSDRWITDELRSHWGTGVDLLDGHVSRFSFSTCGRSNATFADAEGAFVANIDGPVRAVRSYVGANSGPLTQRTEIFYEDRFEVVTDLRVHAIPAIMSYWDWTPGAVGMAYGSSTLGAPVVLDGTPDTVGAAPAAWEYLEGPQGDLTFASTFDADFAPTVEQVWVDDATPTFATCWGDDGQVLGGNGQAIVSPLPNTDPALGAANTFRARQIVAFWPTNMGMAPWAPAWAAEVLQPLAVTVRDR